MFREADKREDYSSENLWLCLQPTSFTNINIKPRFKNSFTVSAYH